MSNAEHLIENAIFAYVKGTPLIKDDNTKHTQFTIEEANRMAQHVLYYLYNGIAPGEAVRVVRCEKCEYWKHGDGSVRDHCVITGMQTDADDYCSYGSLE